MQINFYTEIFGVKSLFEVIFSRVKNIYETQIFKSQISV